MSEPDQSGPSGEDPNAVEEVKPQIDPATRRELPAGIAGIKLPANFNTARPDTWPDGITRQDVDKWLFSHKSAPPDDYSDLIGGEQPVHDGPVNEDGSVPVNIGVADVEEPEILLALSGKAYTAYCESVGGKSFNGDQLPTWGEMVVGAATNEATEKIVRAWGCAVKGVLESAITPKDVSNG